MKTLPLITLPVAVAALAAAGCGTKVVDNKKAETLVQQVAAQQGAQATNVSCPKNVTWHTGSSISCTVKLSSGMSGSVTVHELSGGNIQVSASDFNVH
jgi:hypothetical protein